jgi:hypothetical protein
MAGTMKTISFAVLLTTCVVGCAPRDSFSWIDRHCFVADWTNHYSCLSCCRNGSCQQAMPNVQYEMLVLGDQPTAKARETTAPAASPFLDDQTSSRTFSPAAPGSDQR